MCIVFVTLTQKRKVKLLIFKFTKMAYMKKQFLFYQKSNTPTEYKKKHRS